MKLTLDFYSRDATIVAPALLGKTLVHIIDGKVRKGIITETEAYMGEGDKASHAHRGMTKRNAVMFGKSGVSYVYLIYGMYSCLNVVTGVEGKAQAVLVRGVQPIDGVEEMAQARYGKSYIDLKKKEIKQLADGPGKLCRAFEIDRTHNGLSLLEEPLYIEDSLTKPFAVQHTKRIGIDYAEEAKDFLWRFVAHF